MRIAVYSTKKFEVDYFNKLNALQHELVFFEQTLNVDTVNLSKDCDAIAIFTNDDCSDIVLQLLVQNTKVKYIATRSAGIDHINIPKAKILGLRVAYVPQYSPYAIAEHVVALILALNRKLILSDKKVKSYNFLLDDLIGFDLNGKTVGIIGVGRIGGIVAKIMHGFGCKLLGFDLAHNHDLEQQYQLQYTELETLYQHSDIICIQTPLNEHTKYLINKSSISKMKNGVMIINTSRGGVINTVDLIEGIKTGKVGAAGLDVYEKEKGLFFFDHSNDSHDDEVFAQLLCFDNVLVTGHQAFLTENAINNIIGDTLQHCTDWENNQPVKNEL
jgi:D-lactate dehydrogenase